MNMAMNKMSVYDIITYSQTSQGEAAVSLPQQVVNATINWDEAMEQCGDDEDFLRELLSDTREEVSAQLGKIQYERYNDTDGYRLLRRVSHAINGAASSLMCKDLQKAAAALEISAFKADRQEKCDEVVDEELKRTIEKQFEDLCSAVERYKVFLECIGI